MEIQCVRCDTSFESEDVDSIYLRCPSCNSKTLNTNPREREAESKPVDETIRKLFPSSVIEIVISGDEIFIPTFELIDNPTIKLSDIKNRRFYITDRKDRTISEPWKLPNDDYLRKM